MRMLGWIVALLLVPVGALAQERPRREAEARDVWSEPNPGVRYLHRTTTTPCEIHALIVDLQAPGVRLESTRYADRWSSVSEHASARRVAAAINGGFWTKTARPMGIAIGGGEPWPTSALDPEMGAFTVDDRRRARIRAPGELDETSIASLREAVSGRPILVRDGEIDLATLDAFETANQRQPRTAIGLDARGRTAILVVVDSRRRASRGMTLYELSRLMIELGATDALNLDGGGSSEMYVARAGGVVNVPSGGRWEVALDEVLGEGEVVRRVAERDEVFVRGVEREVMNHVVVIAPEPPGIAPSRYASALAGVPDVELPEAARRAPRAPRVRLGAAREWLIPAAWIAVPAVPTAAIAWLVRLRSARLRSARPRSARVGSERAR